MVPDYEFLLSIIAGVCNTWEWSYHVEQRSALFRSLSMTVWGHFERRYFEQQKFIFI